LCLGERERLLNLNKRLHGRVIGQDEAVDAVADAIIRSRAGLGRKVIFPIPPNIFSTPQPRNIIFLPLQMFPVPPKIFPLRETF
jgi:hypothetical protein